MNGEPDWIEVRVLVPDGWHELAAEHLSQAPCTSVVFGRSSRADEPAQEGFQILRSFFPSSDDGAATRDGIVERMQALAQAADAPELADLRISFRPLPAEDYANSWRKSWKPFRIGKICVVTPEGVHPHKAGDIRLKLEPGGTFGTGRHATTRTCLGLLQKRLNPGARVLDAGTGTGILSVAAALLGAGSALGFDIDPVSSRYAGELARSNGTQKLCEFRTGGFEVLEAGDRDYDVVLANLYSDLIQAHAATLAGLIKPSGWFAFSGCPSHHRDATRAAIDAAGLLVEEEIQRGRWHTFMGRRS